MRTLDINLQIEAMKHETKAQPISNLRTSIRYTSPDAKLDDAKKLTKVIPAAAFRKTANGIQMTAYNGIIQIEVNHLANLMEVNRVKQEAEELSQTYLAFGSHDRTNHFPKTGKKRKSFKRMPIEKLSAYTSRYSPIPLN